MHVAHRNEKKERRLETPAWVNNTAEFREVILRAAERRVYIRHGIRGTLKTVSNLTHEQRLAAIREREMRMVDELKPVLFRLIKRYKTEQDEKLEVQIQNVDSQIVMLRDRGYVGVAMRVAYLYYRCGFDSVAVAEEVGIKPPAVRQILARLDNAAAGKVYRSPRELRIIEARAEMQRVRELFRKLSKIVDATQRGATERELKAILATAEQTKPGRRWTLARLRAIYFMRLQKLDWNFIARKLGVKHGGSVKQGYEWYIQNLHLLPDFKHAAS